MAPVHAGKETGMEIQHRITTYTMILGLSWISAALGGDSLPPEPTPRPGTLAAIAISRQLHRGPGLDGTGVIVITDDNLSTLGQGAALTVMTSTIADPVDFEIGDQVDPKTREKWRRKVMAESSAIAKLEASREAVVAELNRLERGKLDGRTLDRIAKAESKLQAIDAEIVREKAQLSANHSPSEKGGCAAGMVQVDINYEFSIMNFEFSSQDFYPG